LTSQDGGVRPAERVNADAAEGLAQRMAPEPARPPLTNAEVWAIESHLNLLRLNIRRHTPRVTAARLIEDCDAIEAIIKGDHAP
jgi:hypothetical protein